MTREEADGCVGGFEIVRGKEIEWCSVHNQPHDSCRIESMPAPSSPSEAAREAVPECETRDYLRGYSAAILDACELCGPNFDDTPKRREDGAWWHYGVPGEGDRFCEGNELREKYYQRFAALASSQSKPEEPKP